MKEIKIMCIDGSIIKMKNVPVIGEAVLDGTVEMKEEARRELEGVKEEDLIVFKPDKL